MISDTTNNILGALGGVILAVCLAPQLLRMSRTRSARDLSYVFLVLYTLGLVLTAVYLIFEGATVGYISIFVEIAFSVMMLAAKYYLDNYGPHAPRRTQLPHLGGPPISAMTRVELSKFLGGTGGAAFPLLAPSASHAAAHLLLDCQLAAADVADGAHAAAGSLPAPDAAAAADAAETGSSSSYMAALSLREFADMLQGCLDAAGVPTQAPPRLQSFPSFFAAGGGGGAKERPSMCHLACTDGYVTAMWHERRATLAVDFVGASQEAIAGMSDAALAFCRELAARCPGAQIAASSAARLPT